MDKYQKHVEINVAGNTKYIQVWDLLDDYTTAPEGDEAAFQKLVTALILYLTITEQFGVFMPSRSLDDI